MESAEKPYWYPVLTDDAWVARIREDYPEDTNGRSDEWVRESYAHGCKYADVWDHLGDAREDWERLADAYLKLKDEIHAAQEEARAEQRERDAKIAEDYEIGISFRGDEGPIYITGAKIAAAIRNQTQEEKDK